MTKRYFQLDEDMDDPERWLLGMPVDKHGEEAGSWLFMNGEPVQAEGPFRIPIYHPGRELDYSLADAGGFPVVAEKVARVFAQLVPSDVQLFPAGVEGRPEPYVLVNIARLVKCIDDAACGEVEYWKPEDGQPEKTGHYRSVYDLRINPSQVSGPKIFRPWGWEVVIVVDEDIKAALEQTGATGLRFTDVTGPLRGMTASPPSGHHSRLHRMDTARDTFWRSLGELEEAAIVPIAMGGPEWPGQRQAWRVIRRPQGRTLLVTEGLADPFAKQESSSPGFGLELALEVDEPIEDIQASWALQLLQRVADELVEHERVRQAALTTVVSMEVAGRNMPPALITNEGRVGVLLGLESHTLPQHFPSPHGEVRLVTVKALLPSELAYRLQHGKQGREELVRRFAESGEAHLSRSQRHAVV